MSSGENSEVGEKGIAEIAAAPEHINSGRRYFLIGATAAVGAVGAVGAAVPFVASWFPSAKARAAGAPVRIDISKLETGAMLGPIPAWRGMPVFVIQRPADVIERLESGDDRLADPDSDVPQQPDYAKNPWRSQKPEIGVFLGLCTHLGCSPKYFNVVQPEPFDAQWAGGFFCPCHGSMFDLAGRVYAGLPAPTNLEVPPYRFEGNNIIVVGEDEGAA